MTRPADSPSRPYQNRVTPFGDLIATPGRGTLMGNRGCLHDAHGRLTARRWTNPAWIVCLLQFKGRRRTILTPGRYTELFFLDEATALAAGHRPCAECRRADFGRFKAAWLAGNPTAGLTAGASIAAIDRILHAERVGPHQAKVTFSANLADLPGGVLVTLRDSPATAYLVGRAALAEWTPTGYRAARPRPPAAAVTVLTPRSTVRAIAAGYQPALHPTAGG